MAFLTQFSNSVPVIKFHIDQSVMTIGQDFEMDICVPEDGIANNHATLEVTKQAEKYSFIVKSRNEKDALEVNGHSTLEAELKDGDWLNIGSVEFQFTDDGIYKIKDNIVPIKSAVKPKTEMNEELAKEEVKPMSTKAFIEESRFSRRLNRF